MYTNGIWSMSQGRPYNMAAFLSLRIHRLTSFSLYAVGIQTYNQHLMRSFGTLERQKKKTRVYLSTKNINKSRATHTLTSLHQMRYLQRT